MLAALQKLSVSARRVVSVLAAIATLLVFMLPLGAGSPGDKVMHGLFFGTLTLLAYYLTHRDTSYALACLGIIALSGVVELLQALIPGRQMSALDLLANMAGVLIAAALMTVIKGRRP